VSPKVGESCDRIDRKISTVCGSGSPASSEIYKTVRGAGQWRRLTEDRPLYMLVALPATMGPVRRHLQPLSAVIYTPLRSLAATPAAGRYRGTHDGERFKARSDD